MDKTQREQFQKMRLQTPPDLLGDDEYTQKQVEHIQVDTWNAAVRKCAETVGYVQGDYDNEIDKDSILKNLIP
jgi:hypothetical protein